MFVEQNWIYNWSEDLKEDLQNKITYEQFTIHLNPHDVTRI